MCMSAQNVALKVKSMSWMTNNLCLRGERVDSLVKQVQKRILTLMRANSI